MSFPSDLALVTVNVGFDLPPAGGATGSVSFTCRYPLRGASANRIIPPFGRSVVLAADGTGSVQLPATNDPQWTPVDWTYEVVCRVGMIAFYGTLQLDYATPTVYLADLLQIDGAAAPGVTYATLAQVQDLLDGIGGGAGVTSVNGRAGVVTLDKTDVALSAVDNTSDASKPVSTLQAAAIAAMVDPTELASALAAYATVTALGLKANLASPTFTGTVAGITAAMVGLGNATNTSDANKPVSTAQATAIAAMVDPTELTSALAAYATLASPTFTGTVSGVTKAMVALGNVDNTSDVNKPVSTAQATAIALMIDAAELTSALASYATTAALTSGLAAKLDSAAANLDPIYGTISPTDHSLIGWTFDPYTGVQGGVILATAGLAYTCRVRVLRSTITNVNLHFTVAGATLTAGQCFAAVYSDAGALLGTTVDQATNWASSGYKTCTLSSPITGLTPYTWVRVVWWFNGTTGPTLSRAINSNTAITNAGMASNFRSATANTGLTTAAPGTLGALTGFLTGWWVGLS